MSKFFNEIEQGLLEAIEMEKDNISMTERENMPAPTFVTANMETELINCNNTKAPSKN